MRHLRLILALLAIAAITVACSSPGASSGGEESQGGGASQPAETTGGGGGGGGLFGNGSAEYHITGDYTADGELGFVPAASQVNQDGASSLSFTDENSDTVLIIALSAGANILSWGNPEYAIPGATCEFNITRQDSTGAAGTFSCNNQLLIATSGTTTGTANISGSFDARI